MPALFTSFLIDLLFGDPPNRFHPVAAMGAFISNAVSLCLPADQKDPPLNSSKAEHPIGRERSLSTSIAEHPIGKERSLSTSITKHPIGKKRSLSLSIAKHPIGKGRFVIGALIILTGGLLFSLPVYGLLELSAGLPVWARWLLTALLLKPAFALRSLITAGVQVLRALQAGDLPAARRLVALHLVSRDTSHLSPGQVASAAVESLAENLTDSFLSPLFYFALGGVPLAWFYRFVNTADAMIGYHTPQYEYLGKFAARLDDVLNWLPARVAAFSIVLSAGLLGLDAGSALRVMRTQHRRTNSPNAGWTMAAISGALGVRLEKIGAYQLNEQCALPENRSIESACRLVAVAALICLIFCAGVMYAVSRLA